MTAMAGDVNKLPCQAYMRISAAAFVELFGSPEQRKAVERLFDERTPDDEKAAIRVGLDRVADKMRR